MLRYQVVCSIAVIVLTSLFFISCKESSTEACFVVDKDIVYAGNPITFTSCSENAVYHEYDFGDGEGDHHSFTSHIYKNGGTYRAQLRVASEDGQQHYEEKTIKVQEVNLRRIHIYGDPLSWPVIEKINDKNFFSGSLPISFDRTHEKLDIRFLNPFLIDRQGITFQTRYWSSLSNEPLYNTFEFPTDILVENNDTLYSIQNEECQCTIDLHYALDGAYETEEL